MNADGIADANIDPSSGIDDLPCPPLPTSPTNDSGSDIPSNQVTVYGCYEWHPALGGISVPVPCAPQWCSIEIIPSVVTMRAVLTEVIHRQQ
jgi:hypothetical protein